MLEFLNGYNGKPYYSHARFVSLSLHEWRKYLHHKLGHDRKTYRKGKLRSSIDATAFSTSCSTMGHMRESQETGCKKLFRMHSSFRCKLNNSGDKARSDDSIAGEKDVCRIVME